MNIYISPQSIALQNLVSAETMQYTRGQTKPMGHEYVHPGLLDDIIEAK